MIRSGRTKAFVGKVLRAEVQVGVSLVAELATCAYTVISIHK